MCVSFLSHFLRRQWSWIKVVHRVLNLSFRVHFPRGDGGHVHGVSSTVQRADDLPLKGQTLLTDRKDTRRERREMLKQPASTLAIFSEFGRTCRWWCTRRRCGAICREEIDPLAAIVSVRICRGATEVDVGVDHVLERRIDGGSGGRQRQRCKQGC